MVLAIAFPSFVCRHRCLSTHTHKMSTTAKKGAPAQKIELFSPTYFAACTIGGIIGNANPQPPIVAPEYAAADSALDSLRADSRLSHPA